MNDRFHCREEDLKQLEAATSRLHAVAREGGLAVTPKMAERIITFMAMGRIDPEARRILLRFLDGDASTSPAPRMDDGPILGGKHSAPTF